MGRWRYNCVAYGSRDSSEYGRETWYSSVEMVSDRVIHLENSTALTFLRRRLFFIEVSSFNRWVLYFRPYTGPGCHHYDLGFPLNVSPT